MTETPDRQVDNEVTEDGAFEDRSLSEATPWDSSDVGRNPADSGEESIGARDGIPESDIEAATSVGDESSPKDTDAIPNV